MFVSGIPELDAAEVTVGTPIRIDVQAIGLADFPCKVTRTSWSIRLSLARSPWRLFAEQQHVQRACTPPERSLWNVTTRCRYSADTCRCAAGDHWNCFFAVDGHAVERRVRSWTLQDEWAQLLKKQVKTDDANRFGSQSSRKMKSSSAILRRSRAASQLRRRSNRLVGEDSIYSERSRKYRDAHGNLRCADDQVTRDFPAQVLATDLF